jgi:hypothetical protein
LFFSREAFKEKNQVYNKILDYRVRFEASDNPLVRSFIMFYQKV